MKKIWNSGATLKKKVERRGDVRNSTADIARVRNLLNWSPQVTLEEGLSRLRVHFSKIKKAA